MTNCLEIRRALESDPDHLTPDLEAHIKACPSCALAKQKAEQLSAQISEEINTVEAPGLQQRLLLALEFAARKKQKNNTARQWAALAASLAIAIGLSLVLFPVLNGPPNAATLMADVMPHIRQKMLDSSTAVNHHKIHQALRPVDLKPAPQFPKVFYANNCKIRMHTVAHFLIKKENTLINVFILPFKVKTPPDMVQDRQWVWWVGPMGKATVLAIGDNSKRTKDALTQVKTSLLSL